MSIKILIGVCLVIVSSNSATVSKACPENEEPTDCVNPCLPTCIRPFNVTCNFFACLKGCTCKPGYLRTRGGGPCVAITKCGEYCEKNQEYTACGSACPEACSLRNQVCTDNCVQGCYCKKDYIYDHVLGECILKTDCPAATS